MNIFEKLFSEAELNLLLFGLHLISCALIISITFHFTRIMSARLEKNALLEHIDPSVRSFMISAFSILLRIAALYASARIIGVPDSAMITLFGSAGVAIGLALKDSLGNLAGGLMLMFFRPFEIGNYITDGTNEGTVTEISAFYTTLVTRDRKQIILPNSVLTNNTVINCSSEATRLLEMEFKVAYESAIPEVRAILLRCADECPLILKDPPPEAPICAHDAASITFLLRFQIPVANYLTAKWAMLESVKLALDEAGIRIPHPHMTIEAKDQ